MSPAREPAYQPPVRNFVSTSALRIAGLTDAPDACSEEPARFEDLLPRDAEVNQLPSRPLL